MHGALILSAVLLLAAPVAALSAGDAKSDPGNAKSPLTCADSSGNPSDCRTTRSYMNECIASGRFGRCPGDPHCYGPRGDETLCVGRIAPITGECMDGFVTHSDNPAEACRRHGFLRPASASDYRYAKPG